MIPENNFPIKTSCCEIIVSSTKQTLWFVHSTRSKQTKVEGEHLRSQDDASAAAADDELDADIKSSRRKLN